MPLLIGGATTSRKHTAVRIDGEYSGPTVHVLDASRAVGVVEDLLHPERREEFLRALDEEYAAARSDYEDREGERQLVPLEEARGNRMTVDPAAEPPVAPRAPGVHVFGAWPLGELVDYIDWSPFFSAWEIRGRFPDVLDDPVRGEAARGLWDDARRLLDRIVGADLLTARAVVGLFPAASDGDDIVIFDPADDPADGPGPSLGREIARVPQLRQQMRKKRGPNLSLADFLAPASGGARDWVGAFAVTTGLGLAEVVARFEAEADDYQALLSRALADRLAEALAERLHQLVRTDLWGYAGEEGLDPGSLIAESYRGIRPAPGYPACPDHSQKADLFDLLGAERLEMRLTESYAMWPAASVSGWYFAHPRAAYFGLGRIGRDQVADYAARRGIPIADAERLLSANLAYRPGEGTP